MLIRVSHKTCPAHVADFVTAGDVPDPRMVLIPPSHPLRGQAEACILSVYQEVFGAWALAFPNTLIAWVEDGVGLLCAAGLRTATDGFFSEVYLDAPVERVLAARTGGFVDRESIFEVTTLASRNAEATPSFLRRIAFHGKGAGFRWSFFTATTRLRLLLDQLGFPTFELAPADPLRVPDAGRWGSYYAHAPRVCAVHDPWLEAGAGRQEKGRSDA